jgi:hypothetical protein
VKESPTVDILLIAYLLFVVNFLFGVLVATGIVERGRYRKVHHFLYLLTMLGIGAAVVLAIVRNHSLPPAPMAMALLLLGTSRFHGGTRAHAAYAVLCLVVYSMIVLLHR